jgi:hypothetical protein
MALTKIDDRGLTTPIDLLDSEKIRFGTGNDTEIYFDGTDQYFTSAGKFRFKHGSDTAIKTLVNGAVYLYYDNSLKLNTDAYGVNITGRASFTSHISFVDHTSGYIGQAVFGAGDDLRIYHDGSHSYIKDAGTGQLVLCTDSFRVNNAANSENIITAEENGAVNLFYDDSKKFETTTSGLNIHEDTDKVISFSGGIGEIGSVPGFQGLNTAGSALTSIGMRGTDIRFATGSAERLRISSDGKVGIGLTDPSPYYSNNLVIATGASGGITLASNGAHTNYFMFADGSTGDNRYAGYIGYSHSTDTLVIRGCGNGTKGIDIESDGDLKINDGNLVVANGHGIDFSATAGGSADDSVLDDYERGGFNPTVGGSTSTGTKTYTHQSGYYVKIGKVVHCWVDITIASASGMSGGFAIQSLPYAKTFHDSQNSYYEGGSFWNVADALSDSKPVAAGYMPNGYSWFYCYSADTQGSKTSFVINTAGRVAVYFAYTTS